MWMIRWLYFESHSNWNDILSCKYEESIVTHWTFESGRMKKIIASLDNNPKIIKKMIFKIKNTVNQILKNES